MQWDIQTRIPCVPYGFILCVEMTKKCDIVHLSKIATDLWNFVTMEKPGFCRLVLILSLLPFWKHQSQICHLTTEDTRAISKFYSYPFQWGSKTTEWHHHMKLDQLGALKGLYTFQVGASICKRVLLFPCSLKFLHRWPKDEHNFRLG